MKKLLHTFVLVAFVLGATAQTTVFEDNFDSYTVGGQIADQSDDWTTWSNEPGTAEDAEISDDYANSGANSMLVTGTNDVIYDFGGKTSGEYEINFKYYIESGYGGYFNFQHEFGADWAYALYLSDDGTGYLTVGDVDYDCTFPHDTWFQIENHINISEDEATLIVNGTTVHTWEYSLLEGSDEYVDEPKLDVVNFYAAAEGTADPKYYVEDFEFIEVDAGLNPPTVSVDVDEITVEETGSGVDAELFTVENTGEQEMSFEVYPVYPNAAAKSTSTNKVKVAFGNHKLIPATASSNTAEVVVPFDPSRDGTLTHVQSDLSAGVGYSSEVDVRAGVLYKPEHLENYIGMKISEVIVYHAYAPKDGVGTLKVWDRGEYITPGPGEEVYSKGYTADDAGQFNVTVDEDIYITGKDLWVGYEITDEGEESYPIGMDAGPQVEDVNFTSTGQGWSAFEGDDYGNLGIIVELEGDGAPNWMSATPSNGTITAGSTEQIMIDFDTDDLDNGVHEAEIHVAANDPDNQFTVIPVTLDISTAIVDGIEETIGVMTYPNPAVDNINIKSNETIQTVQLINEIGQVVYEATVNNNTHVINTSSIDRGLYMVNVVTAANTTTTTKVIVK